MVGGVGGGEEGEGAREKKRTELGGFVVGEGEREGKGEKEKEKNEEILMWMDHL